MIVGEENTIYKILLVDDEKLQREVNRIWLEQCDFGRFDVYDSDNTNDAEIFIRTQSPDCIILDYLLNDEDGFVFLHKMKKYQNCPPIIFQTAAFDPQLRKKALAIGAAAYFDKTKIDCDEFCLTVLTLARIHKNTSHSNKCCKDIGKT